MEATCTQFLKSLLLRTSSGHTRRSKESNNGRITTKHLISNPEQNGAPSDKLVPLSNPHLHDDVADDMKEDMDDIKNIMRPQHQELEIIEQS